MTIRGALSGHGVAEEELLVVVTKPSPCMENGGQVSAVGENTHELVNQLFIDPLIRSLIQSVLNKYTLIDINNKMCLLWPLGSVGEFVRGRFYPRNVVAVFCQETNTAGRTTQGHCLCFGFWYSADNLSPEITSPGGAEPPELVSHSTAAQMFTAD